MTESLRVTVDRQDGFAIVYTEGYINNQGGEEIARVAYQLIDEGRKVLLLNLAGTKIVNSIGISILIEIIEKMIEIDGKLGFSNLTATIANLQIQVENTSAAESRIRDVDVAIETASLTRNSILQQSAIAILSQANTQPQAALQLLQG